MNHRTVLSFALLVFIFTGCASAPSVWVDGFDHGLKQIHDDFSPDGDILRPGRQQDCDPFGTTGQYLMVLQDKLEQAEKFSSGKFRDNPDYRHVAIYAHLIRIKQDMIRTTCNMPVTICVRTGGPGNEVCGRLDDPDVSAAAGEEHRGITAMYPFHLRHEFLLGSTVLLEPGGDVNDMTECQKHNLGRSWWDVIARQACERKAYKKNNELSNTFIAKRFVSQTEQIRKLQVRVSELELYNQSYEEDEEEPE